MRPVDPSQFSVGEEWVYPQHDHAPSERVRIVKILPTKRSARFEVEFLDGDRHVENIPTNRLRVKWHEVDTYDALMANWQQLDDDELDRTEERAVLMVYKTLLPNEVARVEYSPVHFATAVHDQDELAELMGAPLSEVTSRVFSFDRNGTLLISPAGTLLIAETLCRAYSAPILDTVMEEEKELREMCKRGGKRKDIWERKTVDSSPEYEYYWYCTYERPRLELLRQWCGYRAVTAHGRLLAAESENQRLDDLLARVIDTLKSHNEIMASHFEELHEEERATPARVRPVVDRPLKPSEIPIREVRVRQRNWW